MPKFVGIYDEEGVKDDDNVFEVAGNTATKNIIKIRNLADGSVRKIHKDRVFELEERSVDKKNSSKNENAPKKKAKKKPVETFDVDSVRDKGVLFKRESKKEMEPSDGHKITIESYFIVAEDGKKWKHFNLYDKSLGKKGKEPELEETVKESICGDFEAIEKYLQKKGYGRV